MASGVGGRPRSAQHRHAGEHREPVADQPVGQHGDDRGGRRHAEHHVGPRHAGLHQPEPSRGVGNAVDQVGHTPPQDEDADRHPRTEGEEDRPQRAQFQGPGQRRPTRHQSQVVHPRGIRGDALHGPPPSCRVAHPVQHRLGKGEQPVTQGDRAQRLPGGQQDEDQHEGGGDRDPREHPRGAAGKRGHQCAPSHDDAQGQRVQHTDSDSACCCRRVVGSEGRHPASSEQRPGGTTPRQGSAERERAHRDLQRLGVGDPPADGAEGRPVDLRQARRRPHLQGQGEAEQRAVGMLRRRPSLADLGQAQGDRDRDHDQDSGPQDPAGTPANALLQLRHLISTRARWSPGSGCGGAARYRGTP